MNIYEQWVYDAAQRAKLQVFLPYKDVGVDAIVNDGASRFVRLQIKGSRSYGPAANGWYVLNRDKLQKSVSTTDLWVFVWTRTVRRGRFEPEFVAIPLNELLHRLEKYSEPSVGRYHVCMGRMLANFPNEVCDFRGLSKEQRKTVSLNGLETRLYSDYLVRNWREFLLR